ncbi:hypothetical protein OEZ86_012245 [Tetradesmus obliquus]|nr:hypothetical protein OEZ86_012245 [Tetradesmus obliquus]
MDVLNAAGWPAAALSVRVVRQPCKDITYNNKTYASFRVGVRFNSTTDTQVRDDMWAAVASSSPCTGGYNTTLYKNAAALLVQTQAEDGTRTNMFYPGPLGPNKTGPNWVEYAGPCLPKPKPIIKAPVVNVPVASTSCDPAAVQALADRVKGQVTSGMVAAEAGLVYVEVIDCKPAGTGRRLLASNITVTLSITISPLVETPAQVETATRALYAAITNQPSASLPAGASLDTVLQLLNKNLLEGGADTLLADVQRAIVDSNLATVFNASLTNVTEIAGAAQAITCPNPPAIPGADWTRCLGQIPGFKCAVACTNGGTVAATCTTAGTWTSNAGTACPPAPQLRCLGVPLAGVANANWATNCPIAVGSTCTATCFGAGQATTATCTRIAGTTTADWAVTTTGSCAAAFAANAKCGDTNGDAAGQPAFVCGSGFVAKASASGSSIAGLDAAAAQGVCCDAIYPADATCATAWTAACPIGTQLNPTGQVNGLVIGSTAAQSICCREAPSCTNTVVGVGEACVPKEDAPVSDSCGGTCPRQCASGTFCNSANICQCTPTCTNDLQVAPGGFCGQQSDGCGGSCTKTCTSASDCLASKCQATQSSPRTLSGGGNAPSPCDYQLKWDATPLTPLSVNGNPVAAGFMSRAVILSIHLQQGSGNGNTASFVGWLRIKTGIGAPVAYDYTWQFGA